MGLLDGVLGSLGGDAAGGIGELLNSQGGVAGLAEKFGQKGLGDLAATWIGTGANANISPEQIAAVLGSGPIADFAARVGISPEQASETLAGLLPEAVDRLTPNGQVPDVSGVLDQLPGGLGDIVSNFLKR
ncbi:YidB family protein [Brevundimonas variabilis]|uniref:Uncharacterized protein YidB (DUF937 family) n=1 Tax=Brevundimonas variabilis TaxID=74312 RepID=A0A7W9CKR1_9CAUL|nr:YidB family protein [Brevundimonas variabilis]MBB5747427.1 uncharacterized protein YidB (DUF937 family) [Brevundimonas variabilis]